MDDHLMKERRDRGVAQSGSALRSGRRGRWFESSHPDYVSHDQTLLWERIGNHQSGIPRDVAQLGSALAWGARGRWFKSSHPDYVCLGQLFRWD